MELHLHLPRWERREADWTAAAVSGFAAGAVLMVLELIWAAITGTDSPWRVSQLVAALTMGSGVMQTPPQVFNLGVVAMALATHYALGVAFGLVLGFVIAGYHVEGSLGSMEVMGATFGLLLYLVNFHGVTAIFPWFKELRGWSTLVAHLVFGVTAALLYWKLARRGADPPGNRS